VLFAAPYAAVITTSQRARRFGQTRPARRQASSREREAQRSLNQISAAAERARVHRPQGRLSPVPLIDGQMAGV
jgi:hypothetical protein